MDFFERDPQARVILDVLARKILDRHPDTDVRTGKSQISFCGPRPYCWAWLPIREGIKGRPEHYLIVSFGLNREIRSPRLLDTAEPMPGRFTHHAIIGNPDELDGELLDWIEQAREWKNEPSGKEGSNRSEEL